MRKKGQFFKGLAAGVGLAIIGNFGYGAMTHTGLGYDLISKFQQGSILDVSAKEKESVVNDELLKKMKMLESCVDEVFLMETDDIQAFQDGIYKGYMEALGDPYSCYYTAEEFAQMMESTSGVYSGIGVMVSQDAQTKQINIIKVFAGCPGEEAGMLPGDILTMVEDMDVAGMDLSTVVSYIKGEEGTKVTLEVYRPSILDYVTLEVERRSIEVPTVEYRMMEDQLGYISITEFDEVTDDQYIAAIEDLKAQGMRGLVVDVRDNPGGLLDVVVNMLDYMLPEGTIVYTEDKYGKGDTYTSDAEHYFDLPLTVLTNGNSASASEIFAGAIQDYGIGTIVGTTTFGKGIVQSIYPFSDMTAIKITVSRYFTPKGVCIHEIGIAPDVEVALAEELRTAITINPDEDNQLQTAISVLKELIEK